MKRNRFILGLISALMLPLQLFSKSIKIFSTPIKGFKVAAGEGRLHGHIKLKGVNANSLDLKISGIDSEEGIAIFEQTSLSQGKGTPLHLHYFQNEIFHVLEGKYFFKVGKEEFYLSPGDCIFLPKKVPHAWMQISKKGKLIVTFQPAGKMENFFVTMAALDHEPSAQEIAKIFEENEMQVMGPGISLDKKT